jgi:allophanate hydrolase
MVDLGWELVEVDLAPFLAAGELLYGGAYVAERYASVGAAVEAGIEGLDPVVSEIIRAGGGIPAWRAYQDADRVRSLAAATAPMWSNLDALALPVVPTTFTHDQVAADPLGTNTLLGTYTTFANILDLCAAVAPVGRRPDGHPWGVQLLAPAFHDEVVAPLAAALSAPGDPGDVPNGMVALVVAGAHLLGEAREREVTECGGTFVATTRTAPRYRLHLVSADPPRPGLVRTDADGAAIEVDVWALPADGWTRFVARGVDGLAVGRIELADGSVRPGFVAAAAAGGATSAHSSAPPVTTTRVLRIRSPSPRWTGRPVNTGRRSRLREGAGAQ